MRAPVDRSNRIRARSRFGPAVVRQYLQQINSVDATLTVVVTVRGKPIERQPARPKITLIPSWPRHQVARSSQAVDRAALDFATFQGRSSDAKSTPSRDQRRWVIVVGVHPISRRRCAVASLVPFTIDLTAHEGTRLAAVLNALGPHWNPLDVYTGEVQAHHRLYADLDADQQATYDVLLAAGTLPETPEAQT